MRQITTIVKYIIEKSIHEKIIPVAMALILSTMAIGYFFTDLMIGSRQKVLLDFALLSFQLFEFTFILFFVTPTLGKKENISIFSLFLETKISRSRFLIGLFLGFCSILAFFCLAFAMTHIILIHLLFDSWLPHITLAFISIFFESIFLVSVALCASIILPNLLSYVAIVAIYAIGYISSNWIEIISKKTQGITYYSANILYYLLPDLSLIDIKRYIVYQMPIPAKSFIISITYAIASSMIFLLTALTIFKRKNI